MIGNFHLIVCLGSLQPQKVEVWIVVDSYVTQTSHTGSVKEDSANV